MTATGEYPMHFAATHDALILASPSSPLELELLNHWLRRHRSENPDVDVQVLQLPTNNPSPQVLAQLVDLLDEDDNRSVVPVRVFWIPESGRSNLSKIAGLLAGRDPYRPNERRQRKILRKDPSRARVVAGEPAKVSDLRQQWRATVAGENPREFGKFVVRRAILALERVEYRLLGPEYKSPRLVKPEMLASARFRAGVEQIPVRDGRGGREDPRRNGHRVEPVIG